MKITLILVDHKWIRCTIDLENRNLSSGCSFIGNKIVGNLNDGTFKSLKWFYDNIHQTQTYKSLKNINF